MRVEAGMRIHFMGIGGIGMSGLAHLCAAQGCVVSGCDTKLNAQARELALRGVRVSVGHHAAHLQEGADLLVYSAAVAPNDPELLEARVRGVAAISRGQLLASLSRGRRLVAVAGAHGKTTTSGMAAQLLLQTGWDPTIVVGGVMLSLGTNARAGNGAYLVAETDESDGSFLYLSPDVALITNIDREHLNYYHSFERLVRAFQTFTGQIAPGGHLICCEDDPVIRRVLSHSGKLSYGYSPDADLTVERMSLGSQGTEFRARFKGRTLGSFRLQVPGRHNVLNALAVIGLGITLEIPMITVRDALSKFQGTKRRFQVTQLPNDIMLVEDYAHHPSEIRATLAADPMVCRHRIVVFQPHRFSRTQLLEQEFAACFERADGVIITDIYSAFEQAIPGVSGERLAGLIRAKGHPCVSYVPKQELSSYVGRIARAGDTIFFLGAGDIGEISHVVAERLHSS